MTDFFDAGSDFLGDSADSRSVLTQHLEPVQLDLLALVWAPATKGPLLERGGWPVWNFVSRQLQRQHPDLDDALEVLRSLPRLELPAPWRDHPYGLVWWASRSAFPPGPSDVVGLSIAGLAALSVAGRVNPHVPNELASVIAMAADWESGLDAASDQVATDDLELARFTAGLRNPTRQHPVRVSDEVTAAVLQREYAPVMIWPAVSVDTPAGGADGSAPVEPLNIRLGQTSLRRFRRVTTAQDYLRVVADREQARRPAPQWQTSLSLVQTFDYLGYVLAADPGWDISQRLVTAPDLQSAAAVSAEVCNRYEFETALSGLCTVIDQMNVPPVPEAELSALKEQARGEAKQTLNALNSWLARRLEPEGYARAGDALQVVRNVRVLRTEGQHRSPQTQRKAAQARTRLGLREVTSDWGFAWRHVKNVLAGALDVIRQEVQAAGPATP